MSKEYIDFNYKTIIPKTTTDILEVNENKLRLEFDNEIRNKTSSNLEFLFESTNINYIKWLECKINENFR
jgi:hypothetical protein